MRTHRRPWRAMRRPIVVLTVAALASACAGHSTPQAHGSATSISATSTTAPDPKTAVLAAYQRFWQVWLAANNPPNPNDPRLAEVDTGAQLVGCAVRSCGAPGSKARSFEAPASRVATDISDWQLLGQQRPPSIIDCAIDDAS